MPTAQDARIYIRCEGFTIEDGDTPIEELKQVEGIHDSRLQLTESRGTLRWAFWLIPAAKYIVTSAASVALKEALAPVIKSWLAKNKVADDSRVKIYDGSGNVVKTVTRRDVKKHPK